MGFKKVEEKDKKWGHVFKVGNTTGNYDIRSRYPDVDYTKLTTDDFIVSYESDNSGLSTDWDNATDDDDNWRLYVQAGGASVTKSYNPNNGLLSVGISGFPYAYSIREEDRGTNWQYGSFSGLRIAIYTSIIVVIIMINNRVIRTTM